MTSFMIGNFLAVRTKTILIVVFYPCSLAFSFRNPSVNLFVSDIHDIRSVLPSKYFLKFLESEKELTLEV